MNKSKVIMIGGCRHGKAFQAAKDMLNRENVEITALNPTENTDDQLKALGYSDTVIASLRNMESISKTKDRFEDLKKAFDKVNIIQDEPKSKYINNPQRNFKR